MKVEAKLLGIDLRPYYIDSRVLFNNASMLGDEFDLIQTPEPSGMRVGALALQKPPSPVRFDVEAEFQTLSAKFASLDADVTERISKAVAEARTEISKEAKVKADDATRERVTAFAVNHLKEYTDKLLPAQLRSNNMASIDQINKMEDVRKLDKKLSEPISQIVNSDSASNATVNAIQDNMEEDTSLRSIINALSDDVEKGEGSKKKKQRSHSKKKSKSPSDSAPPPPPPPPPRKAPVVDEKARTSHEAELIEAMTRVGASHDQATNPIIQKRFIFERRAEEARKKVLADWVGHSASELIAEPGSHQPVDWLDEK
ncbi:hypothetical protein OROMI_010205 [Orobanche minor]